MAQLQWTCRLCLNNVETGISSRTIFTLTKTGQMISEVLSNLSSVQIHKNDGFPEVYCGNCEEKITAAVDLCLLIRASDCKLRQTGWYIDFEPQSSSVTAENNNEQNNQMNQHEDTNQQDLANGEPVSGGSNSPISDNKIITNETALVDNLNSSSYKCGICFKTYERESGLDTHKNTQWKCNTCIRVEEKAVLDNHKCPSTPERRFLCKQCNKKFASNDALCQHSMTHENKLGVLCDICGKFIARSKLKNHRQKHARNLNFNNKRKKELLCNNCGKLFMTTKKLKIHLKSHEINDWFCCNLCGKKFIRVSKFNKHMQVHSGETCVCSICKNKFPHLNNLQRHMKKCHPQNIEDQKPKI